MQDFFNPVGRELVLSPARNNYLPDLVEDRLPCIATK